MCEKLSYAFCKRKIPSYVATYMAIAEEEGPLADYTPVDNYNILKKYGIQIPLKDEETQNHWWREDINS